MCNVGRSSISVIFSAINALHLKEENLTWTCWCFFWCPIYMKWWLNRFPHRSAKIMQPWKAHPWVSLKEYFSELKALKITIYQVFETIFSFMIVQMFSLKSNSYSAKILSWGYYHLITSAAFIQMHNIIYRTTLVTQNQTEPLILHYCNAILSKIETLIYENESRTSSVNHNLIRWMSAIAPDWYNDFGKTLYIN